MAKQIKAPEKCHLQDHQVENNRLRMRPILRYHGGIFNAETKKRRYIHILGTINLNGQDLFKKRNNHRNYRTMKRLSIDQKEVNGTEMLRDCCHSLEKARPLTHLRLEISDTDPTNKQIKLYTSILKLKFLTNFSFSIDNCSHLSNQGVGYLGLSFKHLNRLTCLELDLRHCSSLTDEGLDHLGRSIKARKASLRVLSLTVDWSQGVTNKGFEYLSLSLKELTSLKILHLDFIQ